MAKDQRTIHGSVRIGGVAYKAGQEDELEAKMAAADVKRLTDKGVISGFDAKADKAKAEAETAETAAPAAKDSPKGK